MSDIYAAKAALITLLKAAAVPAGLLEGVSVAYGWESTLGERSLYGGGVSFESEDTVAEPGVLTREIGTVTLYARAINRPAGLVEDTDAAVRSIRAAVQAVLKANPTITGEWVWVGVVSGRGDYSQTDDETTSVLSMQVRLDTDKAW